MEKDFKVGDRLEYNGRKATLIGFTDKESRKCFQIEYDESKPLMEGHYGNSELYDENGKIIKCGLGNNNRWNLYSNDRGIKIIEDVKFSDGLYVKSIDKDSLELAKQGITRI